MKAIIPELKKGEDPLYHQLYEYLKTGILNGDFREGEKLPSIRALASDLKVSVTTTNLAYQQLLVEGYITSKPQSGYYINDINSPSESADAKKPVFLERGDFDPFIEAKNEEKSKQYYDEAIFNFVKWKKCVNKILNEYSHELLSDSDSQGEYSLRYEIASYLYRSKGISTMPENIVIGAGLQQISTQLARLLQLNQVSNLMFETPGYSPAHNVFRDMGFSMIPVPVGKDGIEIESFPKPIRCAVYTSPSNQFPTGAVMPISKRYRILELVEQNDSYIIEDDYDSELRYFGKPIPPLKSLDSYDRVIYLGSFSSTLFPAIKISYMVLPGKLEDIFKAQKDNYTQTCSKSEQLTLAYYMQNGYYQANIRKLRRLYSQKLQLSINAFKKYARNKVQLLHSSSGINMLIRVKSVKDGHDLKKIARDMGISVDFIESSTKEENSKELIFHFNQIPVNDIDKAIEKLVKEWT